MACRAQLRSHVKKNVMLVVRKITTLHAWSMKCEQHTPEASHISAPQSYRCFLMLMTWHVTCRNFIQSAGKKAHHKLFCAMLLGPEALLNSQRCARLRHEKLHLIQDGLGVALERARALSRRWHLVRESSPRARRKRSTTRNHIRAQSNSIAEQHVLVT